MTTRSQKRKAVAELVPGDFEVSLNENGSIENLIPSSSKNPRLELENLEEMKTTLRKEIMTDLTKILAENQKEMLKLIAPTNKKRTVSSNIQDSDSDQENISVTRTSTPVKTQTATNSKTTPNNSRNNEFSEKQKNELTRKQKLEGLDKLDNGTSQKQIAVRYGVDRSCVSRIKSNSARIRTAQENNENLEMKRMRKAGGEDM